MEWLAVNSIEEIPKHKHILISCPCKKDSDNRTTTIWHVVHEDGGFLDIQDPDTDRFLEDVYKDYGFEFEIDFYCLVEPPKKYKR